MLAGIGTGLKFSFNRCLGQQVGIPHQRIDRVNAGVEVVLERIEVAVVCVGDLRRDVALGDAVDVTGGHVQRPDHRVQRLVDAGHDGLKVALMLGCVGTGLQFAVHCRLGQHVGIGDHGLHGGLHGTH